MIHSSACARTRHWSLSQCASVVCRNAALGKALRAIAGIAAITLSTNPVDKIVRIL